MKELCALGPKIYAYLIHDDNEKKKAKETKKAVIKHIIMYENYKDCLFNNKAILKKQQRFKSDYHEMYTEEVNQTALSSRDDKRLQTFDRVKSYPHGTNAFKVCERKMMMSRYFFVIKYEDCLFNDEIVLKRQR